MLSEPPSISGILDIKQIILQNWEVEQLALLTTALDEISYPINLHLSMTNEPRYLPRSRLEFSLLREYNNE